MPDRDVNTIRDLIHYQHATIIAKSAFAASDGESRLKFRGDKKFHDSIPPVLVCHRVRGISRWKGSRKTLFHTGKRRPHSP